MSIWNTDEWKELMRGPQVICVQGMNTWEVYSSKFGRKNKTVNQVLGIIIESQCNTCSELDQIPILYLDWGGRRGNILEHHPITWWNGFCFIFSHAITVAKKPWSHHLLAYKILRGNFWSHHIPSISLHFYHLLFLYD